MNVYLSQTTYNQIVGRANLQIYDVVWGNRTRGHILLIAGGLLYSPMLCPYIIAIRPGVIGQLPSIDILDNPNLPDLINRD